VKVKSILVPVVLSLLVVIFNSCEDSIVNNSGTTNVSGMVRGLLNYPIENVKITIQGKSTYTSVNGKFSLTGIKTPFDIYVSDSTHKYYILYKGISVGSDLTIGLPVNIIQNIANTNLVVHYPASTPPDAGKIFFMDDETDLNGVQDVEASTNLYMDTPPNLVLKGKVFLLTYTKDYGQHVSNFKFFAQKSDVTLNPGSTTEITFAQSEMIPVDKDTVSYVLSQPSGSTGIFSGYILNFFNRSTSYYLNYLALETSNSNNISLVMPKNLPAAFTPALFSTTIGDNGYTSQTIIISKTGTNVPVNLTSTPTVLSPENYAVNVVMNTPFTFQKQPISNVLIYTISDTVSGSNYSICTSENSITLNDMSQIIGFIQGNTLFRYYINQVSSGANNVGEYLQSGRSVAKFSGQSPIRYFTTMP
jgi:hypothetical protein